MKPNIYECKICGEHHCEHDFYPQEEEDFRLFPLTLEPPPKKNSKAFVNGIADKTSSENSTEKVKEEAANGSSSRSHDVKE